MGLQHIKLIFSAVFIGGILLFSYCAKIWFENEELEEKYERTFGRVSSYGDKDNGAKFPVILFITQDSQKVYHKATEKNVSRGFEIGDEIELYYDLINPSDVKLRRASNNMLIFGMTGGFILFIAGGLFLRREWKKIIIRARLAKTGKKIKATVTGIGFVPKGFGQSGNYYVIDCSWQRHDGMTFSFRSEPVEADPSSVYPVGSEIGVLTDVNNPGNYAVLL